MTDAFSFAAARLFKDTNLSVAATLWPSAAGTLDAWESLDEVDGLDLGDPDEAISLRVIRRTPDEIVESFGHGMVVGTVILSIQVADAPSLKADDVIQIDSTYYTLTSSPRKNARGLIWTAAAREGTRESHFDAT